MPSLCLPRLHAPRGPEHLGGIGDDLVGGVDGLTLDRTGGDTVITADDIAASGAPGSPELMKTVVAARSFYADAYSKQTSVYVGCMH